MLRTPNLLINMETIYIDSTIIKIAESLVKEQRETYEKYGISQNLYIEFHPNGNKIVELNGSSLIGTIEIQDGYVTIKHFDVFSSYIGYALPNYFKHEITSSDELTKIELGKVFPNLDACLSYMLKSAEIVTDPFTKSKSLTWGDSFHLYYITLLYVSLEYIEDNGYICFSMLKDNKIQPGDNISLLFENGQIIDFPVQKRIVQKNDWYDVFCDIYKEDIELFINERCIQYRITYCKNNKAPIVGEFVDNRYYPYGHELFAKYAKHYLDELSRLVPDYQLSRRTIEKSSMVYRFPGCYVYLMKDLSNKYYKIGISNKPEYREKTLQSEKPSIELLAYKKFPTRKIAEAIESALHNAYSQQRLRGEWFNLNEEDVAAIIETLK